MDAGGEGADSIWLARRGWTVTAVDISSVALARAAGHAADDAATAQPNTWVHHELAGWAPPASAFDLVSAQFMHWPGAERTAVYQRLAAAVAPGRTLLIVGHHPSDLATGARRPPAAGAAVHSRGNRRRAGSRRVGDLVCQARPRPAKDTEGSPVTVRDSVLRARRGTRSA